MVGDASFIGERPKVGEATFDLGVEAHTSLGDTYHTRAPPGGGPESRHMLWVTYITRGRRWCSTSCISDRPSAAMVGGPRCLLPGTPRVGISIVHQPTSPNTLIIQRNKDYVLRIMLYATKEDLCSSNPNFIAPLSV